MTDQPFADRRADAGGRSTAAGLGPLMMDLAGPELAPEDREVAAHPAIGGVVLFERNFVEPRQLAALATDLHRLRSPPLVIAVDHEGGRVQRFRNGFTELPAARRIGARYDRDRVLGRSLAEASGLVAAFELRRAGIDLDFAPVIDLGAGNEETDRRAGLPPGAGGGRGARTVLAPGSGAGGLCGGGKAFSGHGTARGDTHLDAVVDGRSLAGLRSADLAPFAALSSRLGGVMTAHVRFPAVDPGAAVTFSETWIRGVLRRELGFAGIVLSDDLSMTAARGTLGSPGARVEAALAAGCDAVLLLNDRAALVQVLDGWRPGEAPATRDLGRLRPFSRPQAPERGVPRGAGPASGALDPGEPGIGAAPPTARTRMTPGWKEAIRRRSTGYASST